MDMSTERVLLSAALKNEPYMKGHLNHLKVELFENPSDQRILRRIVEHVGKYNEPPVKASLIVETKNDRGITEDQSDTDLATIEDIFSIIPPDNMDWLKESTRKFCQERSVYNALQTAISVYQGENKKLRVEAIPDLLLNAINIDFDEHYGLEFFETMELRWDYYHTPENRIPFRIKVLNEVTRNGVARKTFNCLVGGTNVGKSFGLCSLASDYLRDGLNVLYISCEMREEEVGMRIDENLLGLNQDDLFSLSKESFTGRINKLKSASYGRLFIKEFPTGQASALDVQNTIDELRVRKGFVPDIVICDYLTIMTSYRVPNETNSYNLYKAVSQELRALAVRNNLACWSACQFNRGGIDSSDAGLSELSESAAIAHIADFMLGLFRTEELDQAGQILAKQLKNRYANKATRVKFPLGADINTQTLYDVEEGRELDVSGPAPSIEKSQDKMKERFGAFK